MMLVRTGLIVSGSSGGGFVPTIESFALALPSKTSGCAPVAMVASWVLNNPDNTSYKLRIFETGDEFPCETTFGTVVYTEETYEDGLSGTVQPTLNLQVVRRSDSVVMSSAQATCSSSVAVGELC